MQSLMKSIFVFLSFIFSISAIHCQEEKHDIDIWLSNCLQDSSSTSGMRGCTIEAGKKWDDELNKYYQLLMNELPEDKKAFLKEAQRSWITFRDKERIFISAYYFEVKQGTMWHPISDHEDMELTRSRALQLRKWYEMIDY